LISLQPEKCIGCGICVLTCPRGVFELSQVEVPLKLKLERCVVRNRERCDSCGRCVGECPGKALSLK